VPEAHESRNPENATGFRAKHGMRTRIEDDTPLPAAGSLIEPRALWQSLKQKSSVAKKVVRSLTVSVKVLFYNIVNEGDVRVPICPETGKTKFHKKREIGHLHN
jgi:hypothetical protein